MGNVEHYLKPASNPEPGKFGRDQLLKACPTDLYLFQIAVQETAIHHRRRNVRRRDYSGDAVGNECLNAGPRFIQVGRAVVDARHHMIVKV